MGRPAISKESTIALLPILRDWGRFRKEKIQSRTSSSGPSHSRFGEREPDARHYWSRLTTSPPAIVASDGNRKFISTFGLNERTEPSHSAKFRLPPPWKLPQARLHWLSPPGGVFTQSVKSGISVRLWPKVTTDL